MRNLDTSELLGIWESSMHHSPIERSLYLLASLYDVDINSMAMLSIGQRDARLLKFRELAFGTRLLNTANCPHCGAQMEWEMSTEQISLQPLSAGSVSKVLKLEKDGFDIEYRLPNTYDIMRAISEPTLAADTAKFMRNCMLHIKQQEKEYVGDELPAEIIELIDQSMSEEDPQADIKMLLTCSDCKHQWNAPFDIISFLWVEIDNWAKGLIKEVSLLARAFGWREQDILDLSPQRRQWYLDTVNA
jgi:T4 bacteriophage base plate protein